MNFPHTIHRIEGDIRNVVAATPTRELAEELRSILLERGDGVYAIESVTTLTDAMRPENG